jgi:hypothetical protein
MIQNFTTKLHSKIQIKKNVLIKFCASNYARHDGLVNGVDGIFRNLKKKNCLFWELNINIQKAIHTSRC